MVASAPAPSPAIPAAAAAPCSAASAGASTASTAPPTASPRELQLPPLPPLGVSADLRSVQESRNRYHRRGQMDTGAGADESDSAEVGGIDMERPAVTYNADQVLGSGAFGVVYQASIVETGETVAIKKVLQDKRFKNRELQIMQELRHPNIVELKHAFHVAGKKPKETYLNVVMEYCAESLHSAMERYVKMKQVMPLLLVQLYTYQMLRGIAYMHARGICHRDIKPQNLLIACPMHALKICDFGSAKRLSNNEPNVAYICSRFYRAPELIFGSQHYSSVIDVWSAGCVTAELILGTVLFPGNSGVDQLMEIIKILGTPTHDDIVAMNPVYGEFKFPHIKTSSWRKVFRSRATPEAVDFFSRMIQYNPKARPTGLEACAHVFFDSLRCQHTRILDVDPLPDSLFWFTSEELALMDPEMKRKLIPEWVNLEQGGTWHSQQKMHHQHPQPLQLQQQEQQQQEQQRQQQQQQMREQQHRGRRQQRSEKQETKQQQQQQHQPQPLQVELQPQPRQQQQQHYKELELELLHEEQEQVLQEEEQQRPEHRQRQRQQQPQWPEQQQLHESHRHQSQKEQQHNGLPIVSEWSAARRRDGLPVDDLGLSASQKAPADKRAQAMEQQGCAEPAVSPCTGRAGVPAQWSAADQVSTSSSPTGLEITECWNADGQDPPDKGFGSHRVPEGRNSIPPASPKLRLGTGCQQRVDADKSALRGGAPPGFQGLVEELRPEMQRPRTSDQRKAGGHLPLRLEPLMGEDKRSFPASARQRRKGGQESRTNKVSMNEFTGSSLWMESQGQIGAEAAELQHPRTTENWRSWDSASPHLK